MTTHALLIAACLATPSCYVLNQAFHQNNLFNGRRPIEDVITDSESSPQLVEKLKTLRRILAFAAEQGLNTQHTYRYYIHTDKPVVTYLVHAAESNELKSKTWWFPIVGSVPYLGYFDKADRDREADQLRADGYDVSLSGAAAFSGLGWFEDPVFRPMLARSTPSLAHLFFHELTHRTLWIPGSVEFNENLAEFVAMKLTVLYLQEHDASSTQSYQAGLKDRKLFKAWLTTLRKDLEDLYATKPSPEDLPAKKAAVFASAMQNLPEFQSDRYDGIQRREWNNATVMATSLYSPNTVPFEDAYQCSKSESIGRYLTLLEEAADRIGDPFKSLESLCSKA